MPLHINITKGDARTYRVKLVGTLDTETSEQLDLRIADVLADVKTHVVQLEFHDLTFISSMGLRAIAKIRKTLVARGGTMVIIGAQPQITHVFDIVRMLPKETVFASREEADEYLAAIQNQVIEDQHPTA